MSEERAFLALPTLAIAFIQTGIFICFSRHFPALAQLRYAGCWAAAGQKQFIAAIVIEVSAEATSLAFEVVRHHDHQELLPVILHRQAKICGQQD